GKHFWEVANQEKYANEVLLKDVVSELLPMASERAQTYGVESKLPSGFDDWFGSCVVRPMDDRYGNARLARVPLEKLLQAPPPRVTSNEPVEPALVPVARTSKTAIVLILALIATGVFAFMRLRHKSDDQRATAPSASKSSFDFGAASTPTKPKLCPAGMANVPGGTYFVASKGDSIAIAPFCLDVAEATVSEWDACVKKGQCTTASLDGALCNYKDRPKKDRHPINCVDWDQADAYCSSLGKRLPTVTEWEWAARGADAGTAFPWGEDHPREQLCWSGFLDRGGVGTCEVKSHPSGVTSFGVHDLAGNVSEWVSSPTMPESERPLAGDSWLSKTSVFGKDQGGRSRLVGRKVHEATNGVRCAQLP
ncbi:MAG: formylglycine-generating enzyme family protein, partial [Polyangiales bacterium]